MANIASVVAAFGGGHRRADGPAPGHPAAPSSGRRHRARPVLRPLRDLPCRRAQQRAGQPVQAGQGRGRAAAGVGVHRDVRRRHRARPDRRPAGQAARLPAQPRHLLDVLAARRRSARVPPCWWSPASSRASASAPNRRSPTPTCSDLLPPRDRGRYIAWAYTIGFLGVPASGFLARGLAPIAPLGIEGWRWMFVIGALGSVVVALLRRVAAGVAALAGRERAGRRGRRGRAPVRGRRARDRAAGARPRAPPRRCATAGRSASCWSRRSASAPG